MPATLLAHNVQPYSNLEVMLATSHKAMVVAATGAGKTSVTVKYLEDHNLRGLVVCPKVSICKQWDTVSDNIITMTYQKFCNGSDVSAYDCYIFDEAHHTGASKWGKAVKELIASTDKPVMKRFVKCFFKLLTENFSAWREMGHKKGHKTRL